MIGVIGYFANPCKWLHIGCKIGYNLRIFKNSVVIISIGYEHPTNGGFDNIHERLLDRL
jgi:hypothetical protein